MNLNVHSSITYICQDMEATSVSINRKMDKDVTYIYNRILFNHKKNENLPLKTTWMDLEGIMLSEISQRKMNTV